MNSNDYFSDFNSQTQHGVVQHQYSNLKAKIGYCHFKLICFHPTSLGLEINQGKFIGISKKVNMLVYLSKFIIRTKKYMHVSLYNKILRV